MILGPTVNINRVPLWGRNFEGYGEDPLLSARLGVAYIRGVQGEGVIPSVKHFAANNEEFERHRLDEKIDERTLHEIYLPAFKAAVQEADVWTVMSAYEKVNGKYCAENDYLLTDILKKEFGFKGFVISDWGQHLLHRAHRQRRHGPRDARRPARSRPCSRARESIMSGNSGGWLEADKVLAEVKAGHITEATIDDNVSRILRVIMLSGLMEHPHTARRRSRHAGAAEDRPRRRNGRHRAPEESELAAAARSRKDPLHRCHRTQRARRAHRRWRQFARAAQVTPSLRSMESRSAPARPSRSPLRSASAWKAKIPRTTPPKRAQAI